MSIKKFLETAPLYNIVKYNKKPDWIKDCIPFSGMPRKHPYDKNKILLIAEPFTQNTAFYEFLKTDILYVEEMPSLATQNGENVLMTKVWIKKNSIGMKYQPFEIEDPIRFLNSNEILHENFFKE